MNLSLPALCHDRLARWGLRASKIGRRRYTGDGSQFYDDFFDEKRLAQAHLDLRLQVRRETVRAAVNHLPDGSTVVDIGCGVGEVLGALPNRFRRVGLEYTHRQLLLAAGEWPGVSYARGSGVALPIRNGAADAVVCLEVLEHLDDDQLAIQEIARVLRPGGEAIISVPSAIYYPEYLRLIGHYRHYTRESVNALLETVDFEVREYLQPYRALHVVHYYIYGILVVLHRVLNALGVRSSSVFARPVLSSFYRALVPALRQLRFDRSQVDLACDQRSTFVVAVKRQ